MTNKAQHPESATAARSVANGYKLIEDGLRTPSCANA